MWATNKSLTERLTISVCEKSVRLDEATFDFSQVSHVFKHHARRFTNGVYEYDELTLSIVLYADVAKPQTFLLKARSTQSNDFELLNKLNVHLAGDIKQRINQSLSNNEPVTFTLLDETQNLSLHSQRLSLVAGNPQRSFDVESINLVTNGDVPYIILNGDSGLAIHKVKLPLSTVGNHEQLIEQLVELGVVKPIPPAPLWRQCLTKYMRRVALVIIPLLGLNGYFELLTRPSWLGNISTLAMILCGVWIAVAPAYWWVHKRNIKNIKRNGINL